MTLTQQFILVSILPLSFLGMALYLWRSGLRRRPLLFYWSLTLIAAAVWASSVLRFYGGVAFSPALVFTWSVIGNYAFSVAALGALLTTFSHLTPPRVHSQVALSLSLLLSVAALALDPVLWPYHLPDFIMAGAVIRHFDLWAAVWTASWLLAVVAAWILTQQLNASLSSSLYRNQVHYWLLVLTLFLGGGVLTSVRQPGQPAWQEAGVLIIIVAALTGTISIAHSQLPDLQWTVRQVLSRLSGTLIIFGLTWMALSFIVSGVATLPDDASRNLILVLAAALFAGLFTIIYRLINELTRRLFLPALPRHETILFHYTNAVGNFPEPAQLGQLFLRMLQSTLDMGNGSFFVVEDGPAGRLILRPLASLSADPLQTVDFAGDSPFARYLRHSPTPLVQQDIEVLSAFDDMPASDRALLADWNCVAFMPLHAGDTLIGLVALGARFSGEQYDRRDFESLQVMAGQIGPLLAQAQNLASLRQINDYVFQQNQALVREKRHLKELTDLYTQFIRLVSPELRRPFTNVHKQLQRLQEEIDQPKQQQHLALLNQQLNELKALLDRLIAMSGRIQVRSEFNFRSVHLDEIAHSAIHNLKNMADARQVRIDFDPTLSLPVVLGDPQQLLEAVQHLLHNAIKFNKIGGRVQLDCGVAGSDLYLYVTDTGVGIPQERLSTIWDGFSRLSQNGSSRGAGMGLALTRFIIAAHGGHVEARSNYGAGSVFSIYLPLIFEE